MRLSGIWWATLSFLRYSKSASWVLSTTSNSLSPFFGGHVMVGPTAIVVGEGELAILELESG